MPRIDPLSLVLHKMPLSGRKKTEANMAVKLAVPKV
jgi:hypothetical protein